MKRMMTKNIVLSRGENNQRITICSFGIQKYKEKLIEEKERRKWDSEPERERAKGRETECPFLDPNDEERDSISS